MSWLVRCNIVTCCCCCQVASVVSDSVRPHRQKPHQPPLSLGFSRQEHWSGVPLPSLVTCTAEQLTAHSTPWPELHHHQSDHHHHQSDHTFIRVTGIIPDSYWYIPLGWQWGRITDSLPDTQYACNRRKKWTFVVQATEISRMLWSIVLSVRSPQLQTNQLANDYYSCCPLWSNNENIST